MPSRTRSSSAPAPGKTPSLAQLQAAFQDAILNGGDGILTLIPPNSRTGAEVLFGVYRNAYVSRLVEVIGSDHPLVARYLGPKVFDELARAYVSAYPSNTPNARWISRHLTVFARAWPRLAPHPEVGDLIAIEAALNSAFDAADAAPAMLADLQRVAPEAWERLQFRPHVSAQRLRLSSNALDLWLALKEDADVPPAEPGVAEVLVWRQETTPMLRPLQAEEAMMWDEAAHGVRFGVLCEMLATYDDPDTAALRAAQYLQGWLTSGALSEAAVATPPRVRRRRVLADPE